MFTFITMLDVCRATNVTEVTFLCENFTKSRLYPGAMCEYLRVPEENARFDTLILPENVSFEVGTMIEPIACTFRG